MIFDPKVVQEASDAIEALVVREYCDCGCPWQSSPATSRDVQLMRLASFLRIDFMPEYDSAQAPGNG
jgi:hypothetical protein